MNSRIRSLAVALAGLGSLGVVLAVPPAAHAGPVAVMSQARSVHVAIPSIVEAEPAVDETTTAPDNNPFNATLDRTLSQLDETNKAFASQQSSFDNSSATVFNVAANGETRYSATGLPGIVFAESDFEVQFQLDAPRAYTINGNGSFVDTSGGASAFLVTLTGPGGTVASFTKADFDPANNDGAVVTPTFGTSGTLDPGLYTLTASSGVSGGTNLTEIQASFGFTFAATEGSVVIPLPAGFGPGAALLALLGALAARRALRRSALSS